MSGCTIVTLRSAIMDALSAVLLDTPASEFDPTSLPAARQRKKLLGGDTIHAWYIDAIESAARGNPGDDSDLTASVTLTGLFAVGHEGAQVTLQNEAAAIVARFQSDLKTLDTAQAFAADDRLVLDRYLAHVYVVQATFFALNPVP